MAALTLAGHSLLILALAAPIMLLTKRRVRLRGPQAAMITLLLATVVITIGTGG